MQRTGQGTAGKAVQSGLCSQNLMEEESRLRFDIEAGAEERSILREGADADCGSRLRSDLSKRARNPELPAYSKATTA
jgi:hypothetical protein